MGREANIIEHCIKIVEHLETVTEYLEMDPNYDIILKYAVLNLRRVLPEKTKTKSTTSIHSLSEWSIELARLSLSLGREINRMRKVQGLSPIDFNTETTRKDRVNAKNPTTEQQDIST